MWHRTMLGVRVVSNASNKRHTSRGKAANSSIQFDPVRSARAVPVLRSAPVYHGFKCHSLPPRRVVVSNASTASNAPLSLRAACYKKTDYYTHRPQCTRTGLSVHAHTRTHAHTHAHTHASRIAETSSSIHAHQEHDSLPKKSR